MNCNVRRKKVVILNGKGKEVFSEIESDFAKWLEQSCLTEKQLLEYSDKRSFIVIRSKTDSGAMEITIGYNDTAGFVEIGQPFISMSRENNKYFAVDVSLLLLYIAEKLDNGYRINHANASKTDQEYFHNCISEFISGEKAISRYY